MRVDDPPVDNPRGTFRRPFWADEGRWRRIAIWGKNDDVSRGRQDVNRCATTWFWRKGWDSNPRGTLRPLAVFKTAALNHSATLPSLWYCLRFSLAFAELYSNATQFFRSHSWPWRSFIGHRPGGRLHTTHEVRVKIHRDRIVERPPFADGEVTDVMRIENSGQQARSQPTSSASRDNVSRSAAAQDAISLGSLSRALEQPCHRNGARPREDDAASTRGSAATSLSRVADCCGFRAEERMLRSFIRHLDAARGSPSAFARRADGPFFATRTKYGGRCNSCPRDRRACLSVGSNSPIEGGSLSPQSASSLTIEMATSAYDLNSYSSR
jgi:hypothetical protein